MPSLFDVLVGWVGLSLSLVCLWSYLAVRPPRRTRGRARRRGGYIKLAVSPGPSHAALSMTETILSRAGYSSSSIPPGGVSGVWAIPRALDAPSRLTGRGWSTLGTETLGASGAPLDYAALRSLVHRGALRSGSAPLGDAA